jgi:hypothetical protein
LKKYEKKCEKNNDNEDHGVTVKKGANDMGLTTNHIANTETKNCGYVVSLELNPKTSWCEHS